MEPESTVYHGVQGILRKERKYTERAEYSGSMIFNWKKRFRDTALLRTKRRVKRKTLGGSFAAVS